MTVKDTIISGKPAERGECECEREIMCVRDFELISCILTTRYEYFKTASSDSFTINYKSALPCFSPSNNQSSN